jgi:hypothetical protein
MRGRKEISTFTTSTAASRRRRPEAMRPGIALRRLRTRANPAAIRPHSAPEAPTDSGCPATTALARLPPSAEAP